MSRLIIIISLLLVHYASQAEAYRAQINTSSSEPIAQIKISPGRITLIDLGSIINGQVWLVDPKLARIYALSGLADENTRNIIAIQGLKDTGKTDLTISTQAGIKQFHLIASKYPDPDLILDKHRARILSHTETYTLSPSRSVIVSLPAPINEYVLAGNPELIQLKQVVDFYHRDFLKTFALTSSASLGITDIVIATSKGIIKFSVEIQGDNNEHTNHINFADL